MAIDDKKDEESKRPWWEEYKDFQWGNVTKKLNDSKDKPPKVHHGYWQKKPGLPFYRQKGFFAGTFIAAVTLAMGYWAYDCAKRDKAKDKDAHPAIGDVRTVPATTTSDTAAKIPALVPVAGTWEFAREIKDEVESYSKNHPSIYIRRAIYEFAHKATDKTCTIETLSKCAGMDPVTLKEALVEKLNDPSVNKDTLTHYWTGVVYKNPDRSKSSAYSLVEIFPGKYYFDPRTDLCNTDGAFEIHSDHRKNRRHPVDTLAL